MDTFKKGDICICYTLFLNSQMCRVSVNALFSVEKSARLRQLKCTVPRLSNEFASSLLVPLMPNNKINKPILVSYNEL